MNTKQQAILTRQTNDITTMEAEMPEPVNDLSARVIKAHVALNGQLNQDEIKRLTVEMSGKSLGKQQQILETWYDIIELGLIAQELRDNAQAYGANIASKVAGTLRNEGNLEIAKAELSGLAASYPRLAKRISELEIMQDEMRHTIYEMVVAAVDQLTHNPTKIILWESETNNNKVYLTPDGLGNLFLVYLKAKRQIVARCAYVPGYALEQNVWHLDLSKAGYEDWVARCKNAQPVVKSALSSLPETRLAGRSPEAQKAMGYR